MKQLRSAVRRLSEQYSAWGYKKITRLLRQEGWRVGKRLVRRIRRELDLRIPARRRKRRRRGLSTGLTETLERESDFDLLTSRFESSIVCPTFRFSF